MSSVELGTKRCEHAALWCAEKQFPVLVILRTSSPAQEGDRLRAADYVTGSVEVRQLRSVYKLSFLDIVRVNRFRADGACQDHADDASNESSVKAKKAEQEKSAVRLYVFLTTKKAKARMEDLEETAFLLRLDAGTEGCICYGKSCGDFDQVWRRERTRWPFVNVVELPTGYVL